MRHTTDLRGSPDPLARIRVLARQLRIGAALARDTSEGGARTVTVTVGSLTPSEERTLVALAAELAEAQDLLATTWDRDGRWFVSFRPVDAPTPFAEETR